MCFTRRNILSLLGISGINSALIMNSLQNSALSGVEPSTQNSYHAQGISGPVDLTSAQTINGTYKPPTVNESAVNISTPNVPQNTHENSTDGFLSASKYLLACLLHLYQTCPLDIESTKKYNGRIITGFGNDTYLEKINFGGDIHDFSYGYPYLSNISFVTLSDKVIINKDSNYTHEIPILVYYEALDKDTLIPATDVAKKRGFVTDHIQIFSIMGKYVNSNQWELDFGDAFSSSTSSGYYIDNNMYQAVGIQQPEPSHGVKSSAPTTTPSRYQPSYGKTPTTIYTSPQTSSSSNSHKYPSSQKSSYR